MRTKYKLSLYKLLLCGTNSKTLCVWMFKRKRSAKPVTPRLCANRSPGIKMPLAKSFPFEPVAVKHEDEVSPGFLPRVLIEEAYLDTSTC